MKAAHRAAFWVIQSAMDRGDISDWAERVGESQEDAERIRRAVDELAQRHFEKGHD